MHRFFSKPETRLRLRQGPLGGYMDRYADWLAEQGFCRVNARLQLAQISDFSSWLGKQGLTLVKVQPATIDSFLDDRQRRVKPHAERSTLQRFLRLVKPDPTDVSTLEIETDDSVDLLISDSNGRSTGFDPVASTVRKEIPRSSYGHDSLTNNDTGEAGGITTSVVIFQPLQETFSVVVTGQKTGPFSLLIVSFSSDGSPQPDSSIVGLAGLAQAHSFNFDIRPVLEVLRSQLA